MRISMDLSLEVVAWMPIAKGDVNLTYYKSVRSVAGGAQDSELLFAEDLNPK